MFFVYNSNKFSGAISYMNNKNMMKSIRVFLGLVILFSLLAITPVFAQQDAGFHFFSETGHNVQGAFWQYYQGLANPGELLGFPITEEFYTKENVFVQYFQRGRLELVGGIVKPTDLGSRSYTPGVKLSFKNSMACETHGGYAVCFAFLEFFKANGGSAFLGNPISSFEFQDNAIVQYFQNGRMEWRPSNPEGQRVVMTALGSSYFYEAKEDMGLLDPVPSLNRATKAEVLSLNVRAFPWKAVAYATDEQLIFVVVQDQTMQPVQGATGTAKVTWTNGSTDILTILTGDSGISTLSLPVKDQSYGGLVTVDVNVTHGGVTGHTTTSFRIWY